jgi:hypothetical protein
MGRPSKLTPAQWAEVERRLIAGETARALGREFGISEAAIRQKFGTTTRVSTQSAQVKETAQKIAEANAALEGLPPSQRPVAIELSEILRNTSVSLGRAAELGAKNSHRLQSLANTELQKVDDATPLSDEKSVASLKTVAILTKMANDAAVVPTNLLAANKDRLKESPEDDPEKPRGVLVVPGLMADTQDWAAQAQAASNKGEK